jgi:hypothetical protein
MAPLSLVAQVNTSEPVESITTMEDAAESRWLDALAIAVERPQDALGCAYLLGYVVECRLKAALGRLNGILPAADLYSAVIEPLAPRDRHRLPALLDVCISARPRRSLLPLSALQESYWRVRVGSVADSHEVRFRYKSFPISVYALAAMYEDVEWIVAHIEELWT